jgi:ribosomal protein S18 acetylase RimI-like enzyme
VIVVRIAASADSDLVAAVTTLLPQLSSSAPPPTLGQLQAIIDHRATTLFVASETASETAADHAPIIGMLTLAAFPLPTGIRAWIEDVVVDDSARGRGVAGELVAAALAHAGTQGARTVDLTSRPEREAANRLYVRLGFEQRSTNVYRHTLATT